jgi:transcriptional regulator with XRE-family HTH domain
VNTIERIIKLLKEKKILQKDFANEIGFGENNIAAWKKGKSKSYRKYIHQIAAYLNTSVDYLFCKTDDPMPINSNIQSNADPNITTIQRLYENASPKDREKFMKLLRITFEESFPQEDESEL